MVVVVSYLQCVVTIALARQLLVELQACSSTPHFTEASATYVSSIATRWNNNHFVKLKIVNCSF